MRILIDLQGAQSTSRFRGIGRYSLSLALAMARNAGDHEIWLALNSAFPESILYIRHAFEGLIAPERIRIFEVPTPAAEFKSENVWRLRAAEMIREQFLSHLKPDVIYISSLFEGYKDDAITSINMFTSGICTAVTLYDLIPYLNQQDYLADSHQRDSYLLKLQSLKKADLLLAISHSSECEATEVLQFQPGQVVNISAALDDEFRPIELTSERIQILLSKFGIERKIVLYAPGGFDARKNFEELINAYSILSPELRSEHQLVIVGNIDSDKHNHLTKLARQASLNNDELIITGYLTDAELIEFYNLATLFVFPSKHEGFGLPVLEAMACGAPVIGSNIASIPEVIGLPAALFDPFSAIDIATKMSMALCDETFRNKLKTHGLNQAKTFTWDKSGKHAINALEALVQTRKPTIPTNAVSTTELIQSIARINTSCEPSDADLVRVADCIAFNTKRDTPKQLFLDISVIVHGDAKSGIQRVVRSLLNEFLENQPPDTDVRPIYFDGVRYKYANEFIASFTGKPSPNTIDEVVDFCQDDIYLAIDLNAHLTAAVHDLHMRLQYLGIKLYFVVYDILLVQHPEWWPQGTSAIFDAWLHSISEVSTGLICISEAVADEVRAWLLLNPPKRLSAPIVCSFHLGADVANSQPSKGMPDTAQTILAALSTIPSFLMVGTIEPRKGHAQALAAFELLWKQGIESNLVIVGKGGWLVDQLIDRLNNHPKLNKHLFWLEGISDEFLEMVYAASTCLIYASEGEGFGLPLIEAAQHQKPIIARNLAVFHEIAGDHAFYFSGFAPDDLADAIRTWIALAANENAPQSNTMPYLTWKQSGQQLLSRIRLQ